jgi:hypothetical protein
MKNGPEHGEGEFDRVAVGGIGQPVKPSRSRRREALADTADLLGRQNVERGRVTGLKADGEGVFNVIAEASARRRSIDEGGGRQATGAEAGEAGDGLPVAERHHDPGAFSTQRPPMAACHLRGGGGLVEEHEPVEVEIELVLKSEQACCLHVLPSPSAARPMSIRAQCRSEDQGVRKALAPRAVKP